MPCCRTKWKKRDRPMAARRDAAPLPPAMASAASKNGFMAGVADARWKVRNPSRFDLAVAGTLNTRRRNSKRGPIAFGTARGPAEWASGHSIARRSLQNAGTSCAIKMFFAFATLPMPYGAAFPRLWLNALVGNLARDRDRCQSVKAFAVLTRGRIPADTASPGTGKICLQLSCWRLISNIPGHLRWIYGLPADRDTIDAVLTMVFRTRVPFGRLRSITTETFDYASSYFDRRRSPGTESGEIHLGEALLGFGRGG